MNIEPSIADLTRHAIREQKHDFTAWDIAVLVAPAFNCAPGLIADRITTALHRLYNKGVVLRIAGGGMGRTVLYRRQPQ